MCFSFTYRSWTVVREILIYKAGSLRVCEDFFPDLEPSLPTWLIDVPGIKPMRNCHSQQGKITSSARPRYSGFLITEMSEVWTRVKNQSSFFVGDCWEHKEKKTESSSKGRSRRVKLGQSFCRVVRRIHAWYWRLRDGRCQRTTGWQRKCCSCPHYE